MRLLNNENIVKNQVDTVEQFKILQYLKQNLDIFCFRVYLQDRNTIQVVDRENKVGYFKYDRQNNEVAFYENKDSENEFTI